MVVVWDGKLLLLMTYAVGATEGSCFPTLVLWYHSLVVFTDRKRSYLA